MNTPSFRKWQSVHTEVLRRIHAREWEPGDLIPNEADLALEFGCARTTMNRALRAVAESGLLDRRRKAGTRVAVQPVAKATLAIAVIRCEIEERGQQYGYRLISRGEAVPPLALSTAMKTQVDQTLLYVRALHLADDAPYAFEDRWINIVAAPEALDENFEDMSANEWLLKNAQYTHGEIVFSATSASKDEAEALQCAVQSPLFTVNRMTLNGSSAVTKVRLLYSPGHSIRTIL